MMREQIFLNQGAVTVNNNTRKQQQKGKVYKKPPFNTPNYNKKHNERNG